MPIEVEAITPAAGLSFRLLRWQDNLREVEQIAADGQAVPFHGSGDHWHLHRETELTFIQRGSGVRLIGDNVSQFSGPDLELLGPHLPHYIKGLHASTGVSMQFHWPLEHPLCILPEFASLAPLWKWAQRGVIFGHGICKQIGPKLMAMPRLPPAGRLGLLIQVLSELAGASPSEMTLLSSLVFSVREGERHQASIERVIRRVLDESLGPLPLSEALHLAGMSKANFGRHFPRYTGYTFTEFSNRVRLDRVRRLLLTTNEPISSIAYAAGFNNLSHFNRLYHRIFGAAPSTHRAREAGHG